MIRKSLAKSLAWLRALVAVVCFLAPYAALASQGQLWNNNTGTLTGLTMINTYNAALDALNTCNSGSSAPTNQYNNLPSAGTPSAGNCWYNTTTGALQYYDGAQWVTAGYIDATNHIWIDAIGGNVATNVASAGTTNLCGSSGAAPQGAYLTITGTTTITAFGSNCIVGQIKVLNFSGILALTYASPAMVLPSGATITTAAGDVAFAVYTGSGNWTVLNYVRASGQALVTAAGTALQSYIAGLIPSAMSGSNTTAAITVTKGVATDSTNAAYLTLAASSSWAVSNGNAIRGFQSGTSLTASTTIHMYLCSGGSGTDTFASTSTSPTCPSGYATYFRRIFSFTTGSGTNGPNQITATEIDGGAMSAKLNTPVNDWSPNSPGSSRTLYSVSVPGGVKMGWAGMWSQNNAGNGNCVYVSSPDEPDSTVGLPNSGGISDNCSSSTAASLTASRLDLLLTNTSNQLYGKTNGSGGIYLTTQGWIDFRRS